MSDVKSGAGDSSEPEMKGWLLKWTNYLKGYQRRWFVLSSGGVLSYYRTENGTSGNTSGVKSVIRRRRKNRVNQAEMSHTCRGTISLHGALIHTVDSCTFVISNGGTQTFHIKTANEVERQSWVTALELAKAKAIRAMESEEDEEEETAHAVPSEELNLVLKEIAIKLENLRTCYDLITKHGAALQRALSDLETPGDDMALKTKTVNERATLFRITSNAMINVCTEYLKTAESQGQKWSKMLQQERSHRQRLEEMVEQLAKQQRQLEQQAHRIIPNVASSTSDDEDNEFYDAQSTTSPTFVSPQIEDSFILKYQKKSFIERTGSSSETEGDELHNKSETNSTEVKQVNEPVIVIPEEQKSQSELIEAIPVNMDETDRVISTGNGRFGKKPSVMKQRRSSVPFKPNYPLNLWSIMKNCIGKELSKIPMPVNFNEPLSLLQRLTEDYEYANLLDIAAKCTDPCEQLAYVAAFTISSYSTTANRTGKPFNPLLGETYECDRVDDLGWRVIAEQVSHHPPMAALHCEGNEWTCWQEFTMTSKFRGKYLQITPLGSSNVEFPASGNKYTWRKVTTTVQNIIVGKLWVDHTGEMEIVGTNKAKGIKCHLTYIPYSYFSREAQRRVKGLIMNERNEVKWVLNGIWDNKIEIAPVISTSGSENSPVYKTGAYNIIWTRRLPSPDSEKYYNFTELACQLNEPEEGVAPTDSRLRPDQRLMESGQWDLSNKEKVRLEEKQRTKRRAREAEAEQAAKEGRPYPPYEPLWFKKQQDDTTDSLVHVYKGDYWESKKRGEWSKCPDIF